MSNCVGSSGLGLPASAVAQHGVQRGDHLAHDGDKDDAQALGIQLDIRDVRSAADAVKALDAMKPGEADAFFFPSDAILLTHSQAIIERATSLGMATMAQNLGLVADGALAGYGLDYREEGRVAARYVLLILGGAHPSALPVAVREQHALGINLKTAQVLGLTIPPTLLARADEVIE